MSALLRAATASKDTQKAHIQELAHGLFWQKGNRARPFGRRTFGFQCSEYWLPVLLRGSILWTSPAPTQGLFWAALRATICVVGTQKSGNSHSYREHVWVVLLPVGVKLNDARLDSTFRGQKFVTGEHSVLPRAGVLPESRQMI